MWWLCGTRDGTEHPFATQSDGLRVLLPHAHEHVRYSRPAPEPVDAPADGNMLICCSRPREDLVLDL